MKRKKLQQGWILGRKFSCLPQKRRGASNYSKMPDAGVDEVGEGKAVDYAMWDYKAPEIELRHKMCRSPAISQVVPIAQASEAAISCVPRTVAASALPACNQRLWSLLHP